MLKKASINGNKTCFVLKCDMRKFFDSIDHDILIRILRSKIRDENARWLLGEIVKSFTTSHAISSERKGLPIGNLTSQIFANIYLNEFDQFVKNKLRVRYYARYTDDFVIVSDNKVYLQELLPKIRLFLLNNLDLELHPAKVSFLKFNKGVDFLGYVAFPKYRLVRTKTKRRMLRKIDQRIREYKTGKTSELTLKQSLNSYLGVLSHANTYKFKEKLLNDFWFKLKN